MKWHLQWPFRSFIRIEMEEDDPWRISRFYVAAYRSQIEEIAEKLKDIGSKKVSLHTRLSLEKKCVEICFECGITFMKINVHGEFGIPYEIVITTVSPISIEMKNIFCEVFGDKLPIKFIALL